MEKEKKERKKERNIHMKQKDNEAMFFFVVLSIFFWAARDAIKLAE